MSSRFLRVSRLAALAALPLLISGVARAQQVAGSVTNVQFTNVVGNGVSGAGGSTLTWGFFPSSLNFSGDSFNSNVGQAFSLGDLRFQNGFSFAGGSLESATLGTTIVFTKPMNATETFKFDMDIQANGIGTDAVGFELTSLNKTYSIGSSGYVLRLLGFSNGFGGYNSGFAIGEGNTVSKDVYAKVELAAVPEPGEYAVMGMAALTVCGMIVRARRKRATAVNNVYAG